jgi:hypothetical protein
MQTHVLDWLLEENDPSVRYRTLTDLLGIPREAPEVRAARQLIPGSRPVERVFARMHPDGYWLHRGQGAGIAYATPTSTHFVLGFLAELGLDREDPRVALAAEHYLNLAAPDVPDPQPWQIPPDYRNHQSCLYAHNLRTFIMLGYGADPRIRARIEVLLADIRHDGGYLCVRPSFKATTKSCIRGSVKALMAFAELPELWATESCQRLVTYFLSRRVFYRRDRPEEVIRSELTSVIFPFLISSGLLEPLVALSKMGYGCDPTLGDAWAMLDNKLDAQGRVRVERTYHPPAYFDAGAKGKANKWATLYACLALKYRAQISRLGKEDIDEEALS